MRRPSGCVQVDGLFQTMMKAMTSSSKIDERKLLTESPGRIRSRIESTDTTPAGSAVRLDSPCTIVLASQD